MAEDKYIPKPEHKFTFGLWTVGNRGRDPFGDAVRPSLPPNDAARLLGEVGAWGVNFHDNDLVPVDATAAERDRIVREFKNALEQSGMVVPMATTNLFGHPVFKDGAFTSNNAEVRAFALQKTMRAMDLGAELGAKIYVFWGGREGVDVDAAKDPIRTGGWFREAMNFLCEYVIGNDYDIKFALEPKPNEPRGDLYLPTVGSMLAFIATLDHPEMVGVNPETAHVKMAGLNPYHEFAQALDAGKLFDVHLNGQQPLLYDQDLSFGSDNIKEAFFTIKLLKDHDYQGTIGFDAHPYRTEADPWDFVERNLRTAKVLMAKVRQFNDNKAIQGLLAEIHGASKDLTGLTAKYSKDAAKKLKDMPFDVNALANRRLPFERLDQLVTELLLGVL